MQLAEDTSVVVGTRSNSSERLARRRSVFYTAALLFSERSAKRAFDVLVALAGLVIFSPTLLLAAMAIKIETRGSVFSRQMARGFNNELIRPLRFRTTNEDLGDSQMATRCHLAKIGRAHV